MENVIQALETIEKSSQDIQAGGFINPFALISDNDQLDASLAKLDEKEKDVAFLMMSNYIRILQSRIDANDEDIEIINAACPSLREEEEYFLSHRDEFESDSEDDQ